LNSFVWAQDDLLAEEAIEERIEAAGDAEIVSIDASGGVDGIEEAVFAGSLFATKRLAVVRNAQALNKAQTEKLVHTLRLQGSPADVVIVAVSERPPATVIGALSDVASVDRLQRPRRGELVAWVAKRLKRAGLDAARDAAPALVESVGESLRDLSQAIDQLALRVGRGGRLDRAMVSQHFSAQAEQPIWVLFDAIVKHEGAKAFESLRNLLDHGDEPLPILGALISQIRGVIKVKAMIERDPTLKDSTIAKAAGMSDGRVAVIRRQSSRLSWDWLLDMHRILAQADFELKGGEDGAVLPGEIILERVVAGAIDTR
jgi:DNA polymerase III subunit delta